MKKPNVTVIPPTVDPTSFKSLNVLEKKRVGAYARVSTDKDEQLNSYTAQVDFYTKKIQSNPEWEFVKVYADEGISATNTKKRDGFKEMVRDAMDGKIDLIITKSVSRFARNTIDSLSTVRMLKEKGVEVYFEKENIYTLDSKGELLITIMSSLAQEESRSISENVTWGQRKRMADGKVSMAYKRFLGYEKGADKTPKIVEEEAKTVRKIYALFLEGKTIREICNALTEDKIPTPGGKLLWAVSTVKSILTNEKYTGNAILQKRYTVDFLNKTTKKNEGEVPQYFVKNSHPAIIDQATFDLVQSEMDRRGKLGKQFSGNGLFFCKVLCGQCGGFYGSKVWHSKTKYRRIVWLCNGRYREKGRPACHTPHCSEEQFRQAFVEAFNRVMAHKNRYLADCAEKQKKLAGDESLDKTIAALEKKCAETLKTIQSCVQENAAAPQNQEEYAQRYDSLTAEYKTDKELLDKAKTNRQERLAEAEKIRRFCEILENTDASLAEFDARLWCATVETITVYPEKQLVVNFTGGIKIRVIPKN